MATLHALDAVRLAGAARTIASAVPCDAQYGARM